MWEDWLLPITYHLSHITGPCHNPRSSAFICGYILCVPASLREIWVCICPCGHTTNATPCGPFARFAYFAVASSLRPRASAGEKEELPGHERLEATLTQLNLKLTTICPLED
jgi:hypothetical protein